MLSDTMQSFYDYFFSSDTEKDDMSVDYELQEALERSLAYQEDKLHAFTEELHLKRALSDSLSFKQPYFPSAMERLIALSFPVRDHFIPILIERGNYRDLVSLCTTNTTIYAIYKKIEEKCQIAMFDYRLVPSGKISGTYKIGQKGFKRKQITRGKAYCTRAFVVAFCDQFYSLKTDTRLYICEYSKDKNEYRYFYQDKKGEDFRLGLCSNEKIKDLLFAEASHYVHQCLMG